jgi:sortase A
MKRLLTPIVTLLLAAGIGLYLSGTAEAPVTPSQPVSAAPRVIALAPPPKPVESLSERLARKARAYVKQVKHGQVIGYITAPRLGLHHWAIREGVQEALLNVGPGHYPQTTLPGLAGTTAIAGHDVTPVGPLPYGPFHWLNRMRPGDKVTITMPYGVFTYTYHRSLIINPDSGAIDTYRGFDRLVLSMCWPRYTADKRWIVTLWLTNERGIHATS